MKYIDNPDKMQLEIIKKTLYLAAFPLLSSLIFDRQIFLGLIFGLVISFLFFRLKLLNIKRAVEMEQGQANTFIRNRYFVEYIAILIGLIVAYNNQYMNVWAAAAGLFLIKLTVLSWAVLDIVKKTWKNKLDSFKK